VIDPHVAGRALLKSPALRGQSCSAENTGSTPGAHGIVVCAAARSTQGGQAEQAIARSGADEDSPLASLKQAVSASLEPRLASSPYSK